MQIVVISDSHRNGRALQEVVQRHKDADLVLHLGDGNDEFLRATQKHPQLRMLGVLGNCDFCCDAPLCGLINCGQAKIFYTHGHLYRVKYTLEELLKEGQRQGANVLLYGHTHVAAVGYQDGIHLMNPGSLGEPRGGAPSYGMIDVSEAGIVCRLVTLDGGIFGRW